LITLTGTKHPSSQGSYFYFDFLECAVASDVPDAPETRTDIGLATDLDTDHPYKLSPQRLIWNLQKLRLVGEIDHYAGVFWWNQRVRVGGTFPTVTVTFGCTWADGDAIWLNLGGSVVGGAIATRSTFAGGTSRSKAAVSCCRRASTRKGRSPSAAAA
jgi:hypothetical protein